MTEMAEMIGKYSNKEPNATFHCFKRSGKWYTTGRGLLPPDVFQVFGRGERRKSILSANGGCYPGLNTAGDDLIFVVEGDASLHYAFPLMLFPPDYEQAIAESLLLEPVLRTSFPHFQGVEPITKEAIEALGQEFNDMVVNWAPVKQFEFTEGQREEIATILQTIATVRGLPGPRDLDVALDAIQSALQSHE